MGEIHWQDQLAFPLFFHISPAEKAIRVISLTHCSAGQIHANKEIAPTLRDTQEITRIMVFSCFSFWSVKIMKYTVLIAITWQNPHTQTWSPELWDQTADLRLRIHVHAYGHPNYMCTKPFMGLPVRCNLSAGELKSNLGMWRSCSTGEPKLQISSQRQRCVHARARLRD